jgi:hypothetical protein
MGTATARAEFGEALTAALPDFVVFPDENEWHETVKASLFFERTRVAKFPGAPQGILSNSFALILVAPPNSGQDFLDNALDDTLDALTDATDTAWDDAVRGVYKEQYPCFTITLTTNSKRKG